MTFISKLALVIAVGRHISGVFGGGMILTIAEEDGRQGSQHYDGVPAGLRTNSLARRSGGTGVIGGTRGVLAVASNERLSNTMSKEVRRTSFSSCI